jgi:hypothetical protein
MWLRRMHMAPSSSLLQQIGRILHVVERVYKACCAPEVKTARIWVCAGLSVITDISEDLAATMFRIQVAHSSWTQRMAVARLIETTVTLPVYTTSSHNTDAGGTHHLIFWYSLYSLRFWSRSLRSLTNVWHPTCSYFFFLLKYELPDS